MARFARATPKHTTQRVGATGQCRWGDHDLHAARVQCRGIDDTEPCTRGRDGGSALACHDHDARCCRCQAAAVERAFEADPAAAERVTAAILRILAENWRAAQEQTA